MGLARKANFSTVDMLCRSAHYIHIEMLMRARGTVVRNILFGVKIVGLEFVRFP